MGSLGLPLGPCSLSVTKASSSAVGCHQNVGTRANRTDYGGRGSASSGFGTCGVTSGCLDVYDEAHSHAGGDVIVTLDVTVCFSCLGAEPTGSWWWPRTICATPTSAASLYCWSMGCECWHRAVGRVQRSSWWWPRSEMMKSRRTAGRERTRIRETMIARMYPHVGVIFFKCQKIRRWNWELMEMCFFNLFKVKRRFTCWF
jgi:hypothetical protein